MLDQNIKAIGKDCFNASMKRLKQRLINKWPDGVEFAHSRNIKDRITESPGARRAQGPPLVCQNRPWGYARNILGFRQFWTCTFEIWPHKTRQRDEDGKIKVFSRKKPVTYAHGCYQAEKQLDSILIHRILYLTIKRKLNILVKVR